MKCSEEVRRSSRAVFANETVRQAPEQDDSGSAKCGGLLRRDEMVLRQATNECDRLSSPRRGGTVRRNSEECGLSKRSAGTGRKAPTGASGAKRSGGAGATRSVQEHRRRHVKSANANSVPSDNLLQRVNHKDTRSPERRELEGYG